MKKLSKKEKQQVLGGANKKSSRSNVSLPVD